MDTRKDELSERILIALQKTPKQKAVDLAKSLGVDRRDVNQRLYKLGSLVVQDAGYRWSVGSSAARTKAATSANSIPVSNGATARPPENVPVSEIPPGPSEQAPQVKAKPTTEIGRLCHYYLEAIGHDSGEGVTAFASSKFDDLGYAELPSLPLVGDSYEWWNHPGVSTILRKVRMDRNASVAWLGYPVRVRYVRTQKWSGYFVDPVMLWSIEFPEQAGSGYRFGDDLPVPNFAHLRTVALGDPSALAEEAARLDEDLGLNAAFSERPEVDELIARLVSVRPDWDWVEQLMPEACSADPPLSEITTVGIYNRAIVIPGKRSPYTQGLESELKVLGDVSKEVLDKSILGSWLSGQVDTQAGGGERQALIEVLPMNTEQRMAVESALYRKHTVVTGPPGTGKSQVVTNFLMNAAWQGKKVLFASKNNKAVDVVEARVNGLGNRPVLLRLGSKEYQASLANYLTAMLSGTVGDEERQNYSECLEKHNALSQKLTELDKKQAEFIGLRNTVDELEKAVEIYRERFGPELFASLDESLVAAFSQQDIAGAIDGLDATKLGFVDRVSLMFSKGDKVQKLSAHLSGVSRLAAHLRVQTPPVVNPDQLGPIRDWLKTLSSQVDAANACLRYQRALNSLKEFESLEEMALKRKALNDAVSENSEFLWRAWVQLAPERLSGEQRKKMAEYAAALQLLVSSDSETVNQSVKSKARRLQSEVSEMFSCWAVTSLSAKGKVPFDAGHFDIVVIDEASQCDIASAIPLLFRAKQSVIIGDPMQLRHISSVSKAKDSDLQAKFDLVENHMSWMYSVNSLYDLAASIASPGQIINLRDHHRCHADIIGFSNEQFYGGKLRVATKYSSLRRPTSKGAGVVWTDVVGNVNRPASGGAVNSAEAEKVVQLLVDLLIDRGYEGTVGVVTPFRAQDQLIKTLISKHEGLQEAGSRAKLLVDTVHKFQGDERDVMFFSPVVSDGIQPGAIGFLRSNGNLFNVAITRARSLLHVVGDRSACSTSGIDYLEKFVAHVSNLTLPDSVSASEVPLSLGRSYPDVARPERVSDWERLFYTALFDAGLRPIPQFSVEQYELDFALIVGNRRLDIEVDGERYHRAWTGELCLRDQLRNQRLIELGWEVKRFWVYEIRDRLPDCVKFVKEWVATAESET